MVRVPAAKLVISTVAAVVVLGTAAFLAGRAGPRACEEPTSSVPAGFNVVSHLVGCSKAEGERLLQRLGIRFRVEPGFWVKPPVTSASDGRIIGQLPDPRTLIRDRREIVLIERCLPAPCPSPRSGKKIYDPCTCATR